jgi:hypothetical protein
MYTEFHDDKGGPIDRAIRKAMDEGKFDHLAGSGQPFPKEDENPWEDPAKWAAYRMLKSAGFSLPWIEERREIEEMIIAARASLIRSWRFWRDAPPEYSSRDRWQMAVDQFRERAEEINKLIRSYNLKAPLVQLHIMVVDVEREIKRVMES